MHLKQLETIFANCQRQLFVTALSITRNREMAEDAVHDSLTAVAAVSTRPENLKAYLFRTVRNRALHLTTQQDRNTPLEEDYLDEASANNEDNIFIQQIKAHIGRLDLNERQTLILKLFEDLSFNEIATLMESSPNTVASWYRRGLEKLKEMLNEAA